jgi:hypothetical protein
MSDVGCEMWDVDTLVSAVLSAVKILPFMKLLVLLELFTEELQVTTE